MGDANDRRRLDCEGRQPRRNGFNAGDAPFWGSAKPSFAEQARIRQRCHTAGGEHHVLRGPAGTPEETERIVTLYVVLPGKECHVDVIVSTDGEGEGWWLRDVIECAVTEVEVYG